jgi:glycosyltransferase involved in cell wall biosynthesis
MVVERGGGRALLAALARHPRRIGDNFASAQLLRTRIWWAVRRLVRPRVLDLFDHPTLQREAMGLPLAIDERQTVDRTIASMIADFPRVAVVSQSFAELVGVPAASRILIPNGTDATAIQPSPYHGRPVIGMASGAAPGRGIEAAIEAVALLRSTVPDARLRLAVAASGVPGSHDYLAALRSRADQLGWLEVDTVPYARMGAFLASASVLTVLLPPGTYWDVASPVKLFDSMAAGRPVVATPRIETARIITQAGAGVVAPADRVEDVAAAIAAVLGDPERAAEMGAAARRCAETTYDWRVLSSRLADAVLGPD